MKYLALLLLIGVVFVSGCVGASYSDETADDGGESTSTEVPGPDSGNETGGAMENATSTEDDVTEKTMASQLHVIEMTDSGFEPRTVTISMGDTVEFSNTGTRDMRPSSAVHPTHRVYPGSDIGKCGTDEEDEVFDSCMRVSPGDSWSFTFNEKGSWNYHDHLRSSVTGTIVVE